MPFTPVPTRPAGPRGRHAALRTVAPVVVLAVVVVAAWAGAAMEGSPADSQTSDAPPSAEPAQLARPGPVLPGMDLSIAPRVAFGLDVGNLPETLARRHGGETGGELVAVAGYLGLDPRRTDCVGPASAAWLGGVCQWTVTLSARMVPGLSTERHAPGTSATTAERPGPHLHARLIPGSPVPPELAGRLRSDAPDAMPVAAVVIGRFDEAQARECQPGRRHCGEAFVLERVAWADGQWLARSLVRDPAIPPAAAAMPSGIRRLLTSRESDRGEVILSEALLTVAALRRVDPAAAAALGGTVQDPVWYVRSIGRRTVHDGRGREVAWAVLDHETGLVLATGDAG